MEDDQSKIVHENILNFKNKDENFVLNSIRQIGKIAEVLGLERTVNELLPYLHELMNEHAVVVSALLEGLLSLQLEFNKKEVFNGIAFFFEEACGFQERGLRAQGIQGLCNIVGRLSPSGTKELAIQLLGRLRSTSSLEKRLAAAKVLPRVAETCRGIDDQFKQVLEVIKEMLEDPSLEVVSAVLQALPKIVAYCKPQNEKMVRHIITFCLEKGPDFIRAQTVSSILSLVDVDRASGTSLLRTASSLSDWRVRYAVCSSVGIIGEKLGTTVFASFLVKNIGSYLTDQNPDTRISAMETFPLLCKYAEADLLASEIVNGLTHIASDTEVTVKIALATYLPCLITKLGKKKFNEFFLPLILALLRDEAVDVKAAMVGHFGPIFEVIGPNVLLDAVEPAFIDLSKCVLWRHKRTCLTFLCAVAESGGREAVRDSLVKVLVDLVKDDFESVREVVVETIKRLRDCLKEDWLAANVLPEVEKDNTHFKYRVAYAKYAGQLCGILGTEAARTMFQHLIALTSDKVPNVKIVAANNIVLALKTQKQLSTALREAAKASLQKMTNDTDRGVVQNAKEQIKQLEQ